MIESRTPSVDYTFKLHFGPRSIRTATCACPGSLDDTANRDLVPVWCTDTLGACPVCGRSPMNSGGLEDVAFRLQEATGKLVQSVDDFMAEARKLREQMAREREHPPIARLPQHHWGDFRRRRPAWQKAEPFVKKTQRPKRW